MQKLVFMVDTSGSMLEGNKKDQVCTIVESQSQSIGHLFAFGDTIRGEYQPSELRALDFNTGTQLDRCLREIFVKLKDLDGNRKHFVLITDAEDTIPFVDDLKTAWKECQEYHKNKGGALYGEPILIGEGECAKDIEDIFGYIKQINVEHVTLVLSNLLVAVEVAQKCDEELDNAKKILINVHINEEGAEKILLASKKHMIEVQEKLEQDLKGTKDLTNEVEELENENRAIQSIRHQLETQPQMKEMKEKKYRIEKYATKRIGEM